MGAAKEQAEKIVDSLAIKFVARSAMIIAVPFFGWFFHTAFETYKEDRKDAITLINTTNAKMTEVRLALSSIDGMFKLLQSQIDNNERNTAERLAAHRQRLDKLELKTDELQLNYYKGGMPR